MQISEPAEYVLLGLLYSRPLHGYELFQQFESAALSQIVHLEMSQMYAFLKKLERMQYIQAQLESQGVRPPRRVYHLTPQGQKVFFLWLTLPAEKPRDIRILFLIKLYFVQRFIPGEVSHLVAEQIQSCQRFLERLEAKKEESVRPEEATFFDSIVLSSRIYQTRALLEWLHELQQKLAEALLSLGSEL